MIIKSPFNQSKLEHTRTILVRLGRGVKGRGAKGKGIGCLLGTHFYLFGWASCEDYCDLYTAFILFKIENVSIFHSVTIFDSFVLFLQPPYFLIFHITMLKHPKKYREVASRFEYYTQVFTQTEPSPSKPEKGSIRKQMVLGASKFHYLESNRESLRHFELINVEMLERIADKIFRGTSQPSKQDANYHKEQNFKPSNEQISIFINPHSPQVHLPSGKSTLSEYSSVRKSSSLTSTMTQKEPPNKYSLFIIHASKQPNPQWVYFGEKITLEGLANHMGDHIAEVTYQTVIGVENQAEIWNTILNVFTRKNQSIVMRHLQNFEQRVGLFECTLSKQLKTLKIRHSHEQRIAHPQFKRQDALPIQQYKKFQHLRIQIYRFYTQLNKHRKINHYSIDNLICRFLKFREYNYEQTLKSIKNYLTWERSMRERYNLQSFAEYREWNLYEMIGRDKQGRILLLFRPYMVYPEKIADETKYIDYTLYMLDIFIQDNTEGYIDDFILIADYGPFGAQHFKLSLARDVADRAKELFPDRQYKLVCFGLGSFSYFMYKFIKPFLPSYVMDKTAIFGTDKQELKEYLAQHINLDELPAEILGQRIEKGQPYESTNDTKKR